MTDRASSSYARIADLPVLIDGYDLEGLDLETGGPWVRKTTLVRLRGGGMTGIGEDPCYSGNDQERWRKRGADLDLAGETTLGGFSRRLDSLDLHPDPPEMEAYRDYRRWAYESAALDLALRQAGRSLSDVLAMERKPLHFVCSSGLGHPPSLAPIEARRAVHAGMRFKLDATSDWDEPLLAALARTGAVDVVDFKGAYRGTPVDTEPDAALYRRVLEALPQAWIEDPHSTPEIIELLRDHEERVTWDAPLHCVADIDSMPIVPKCINVKPSRFGTLSSLFEVYDTCRARGIAMYGGGQFELGAGRNQIQELAALFHPDGPNDVAPAGYHRTVPARELPGSPMAPAPARPGFGAT